MKRVLSLAVGFCLFVPFLSTTGGARGQAAQGPAAKLLHELEDGGAPQWLSPDGKTLAVRNVQIHLYDVASGEAKATVPVLPEGAPAHVFFTPDSKALVVQTDRVRVVGADDGKLIREFAEGTVPVNLYTRRYTPYEETSYDSSTGYTATTLHGPSDAANLEELPALTPSERVVSPDWKLMLVRAAPDRAAVYDFATGELKQTLKPAPGGPTLPRDTLGEFSPDGSRILTTHADKTPRLWDAATGELVADLAPQSKEVDGARFSHDGKFVATTSRDGVVKLWDGASGKLLHTLGSKKEPTFFAAWNPRSATFVTKSRKWEVDIWDASTGKPLARLDRKTTKEKFDKNLTFVYSPDGKLLLTRARVVDNLITVFSLKAKQRYYAHLWDAATGKLSASLPEGKSRLGVEHERDIYLWTPNSRFIVIAGGWTTKLWRADGTLAQELEGNSYLGATLSRDGTLLVAGHAPTIGLKDVLKVFIGKLPKDTPFITRVWRLEQDAATVSSR